jgi:hypothetical protein
MYRRTAVTTAVAGVALAGGAVLAGGSTASAAPAPQPTVTNYSHSFTIEDGGHTYWTAPVPTGGQVVSYWYSAAVGGVGASSVSGLHGQGAANTTPADAVVFEAHNATGNGPGTMETVVLHYTVLAGVAEKTV